MEEYEACDRCGKSVSRKNTYHVGTYETYDETSPLEFFCVGCFLELCKDLSTLDCLKEGLGI